MNCRILVAVVVSLAIIASAVSVAAGADPGTRLGYQILTAHSAGLSWLLVAILLAVTGVPLATFVLRDELYLWDKWKMQFLPLDRAARPVFWWLMLWTDLALFLAILGLLFIASR